jgi:hypothetical protein
MSTRLCLFGVPTSIDEAAILAAVSEWLAGQPSRPGFAAVGIQADADMLARRWFYVLVDRSWAWTFEATARALAARFDELTAVLYDDRSGVFKFEHRRAGTLVLGLDTVGPYIDVHAGTLKGSYPQSGFSVDELRELGDKPWDDMTPRERDAVSNYAGAVTIGINELFPDDERAFVSMGYETHVHQIVADRAVTPPIVIAKGALPQGLWNFPSEWDGSIYS